MVFLCVLLAGASVGAPAGDSDSDIESGAALKLTVRKFFAAPGGAQQGIATDGTHVFVQSTFVLVKYDMTGAELARTSKLEWHHGGITYHDGKVYAAASECCKKGTKVHLVCVYDAETLEKVAEHDIGEHFTVCAGGIAYYDGHFYVAESYFDDEHNDYIVEFDPAFNRVASYTLDFKCPYGIQGLDYIPQLKKFMVNSHGREFYLVDTSLDSGTVEPGLAPFNLQDVAYLNPATLLLNQRDSREVAFVSLGK